MTHEDSRRCLLVVAVLSFVFSCIQPACADTLVFAQAPFPYGGGAASQNAPQSGFTYTAYDDFVLSRNAHIGYITWRGAITVGGYSGGIIEGTVTGFSIQFWSDNSGQPGVLLSSEYVSGNANQTFVENWVKDGHLLNRYYDYSTLLSTSFFAQKDTRYWLSVVPDMVFPPQWFWTLSYDGNQFSYGHYQDSDEDFYRTFDFDSTFSLYAPSDVPDVPPVPEPSGLSLMLVGIPVLIAIGSRCNGLTR